MTEHEFITNIEVGIPCAGYIMTREALEGALKSFKGVPVTVESGDGTVIGQVMSAYINDKDQLVVKATLFEHMSGYDICGTAVNFHTISTSENRDQSDRQIEGMFFYSLSCVLKEKDMKRLYKKSR